MGKNVALTLVMLVQGANMNWYGEHFPHHVKKRVVWWISIEWLCGRPLAYQLAASLWASRSACSLRLLEAFLLTRSDKQGGALKTYVHQLEWLKFEKLLLTLIIDSRHINITANLSRILPIRHLRPWHKSSASAASGSEKPYANGVYFRQCFVTSFGLVPRIWAPWALIHWRVLLEFVPKREHQIRLITKITMPSIFP